MRRLACAIALGLLTACGEETTPSAENAPACDGGTCAPGRGAPDAPPGSPPIIDDDGCQVVEVSSFRFAAGASSGWFSAAWGAGIEPTLGEGWQGLGIKVKPTAVRTGRYDLSKEPIDTGRCERCVYVTWAGSGDHFQLALATAGTLVVDEIDDDRGILVGSLEGVTFRHASEVSLHSFVGLVEGGRCLRARAAKIDTRPDPTRTCLQAGDCANALQEICDPKTGRCAPAGCSAKAPSCEGTGVCQIQDPEFGTGACYARCTPFASGGCPTGQDCVPVDYVGRVGVCKRQGPERPEPSTTLKPGASCTPRQIATGCGPGHVCATDAVYWHYDHCYAQCDYFAAEPGCAKGRCYLYPHSKEEIETSWLCGRGDCHFGGFCVEPEDTIGLDRPCPSDWDPDSLCGGDGRRSGICAKGASGTFCRRFCRTSGSDCAAPLRCRPFVLSAGSAQARSFAAEGLGVCSD
jgi:hypothetical protein